MSGKRAKKSDSKVTGIRKFFNMPESNTSSREPAKTGSDNSGTYYQMFKVKKKIAAAFNSCSLLHNYYLCKLSDCCLISLKDTLQAGKGKFSHSWLTTKGVSFDKTSELWWLVCEENGGMFCLLCRKHNLKGSRSKSNVWNVTPSI